MYAIRSYYATGLTVDVPSLPTTMPAAELARAQASSSDVPAASAEARVPITVYVIYSVYGWPVF